MVTRGVIPMHGFEMRSVRQRKGVTSASSSSMQMTGSNNAYSRTVTATSVLTFNVHRLVNPGAWVVCSALHMLNTVPNE